MKIKKVRAVERQLQQLDMKLRRFKEELLNVRVVEINTAIRGYGDKGTLCSIRVDSTIPSALDLPGGESPAG